MGLLCAILGHRYVVERHMSRHARKVGCTRCHRRWGMHDPTRTFVPWDAELEALYAKGGVLCEVEESTSVGACAQQSVRPDDTTDDTTPAAQPAGRTGEHE